ncbi:hypothetical protein [Ottowia sp.]|uniref:hypothetical protein n=1 Tax=Ottowia sp. TaxID=1898956 RepID=UPI003A888EE1
MPLNAFSRVQTQQALVGACLMALLCGGARGEESAAPACVPPISYLPLDGAVVGLDTRDVPALGTYERISPDGRYVLRSYSGAQWGRVSLMELPASEAGPIKAYRTPFDNEAFPVQGTWRYLVDVNGAHYRFADVLRLQAQSKPLFKGGMTGFYAAASEMAVNARSLKPTAEKPQTIFVRSLSWPQSAHPDQQGVGPLQIATLTVRDDGQQAQIIQTDGPHFICGGRAALDGNVYALPMISIDGAEFSAIPQVPRQGKPTMRVYGLGAASGEPAPCDLRADLGFSPGKAVFGYPSGATSAWLTYSDLGHVYVYDRGLATTFRLAHGRHRVLASAFPGLTRDGRVIYGATWRDCPDAKICPERAGYVIADPYQSDDYRNFWHQRAEQPPKACITQQEVDAERARFAQMHGLPP